MATESFVNSKELKRKTVDAYVANLPLHEQSGHVG